MKNSEIILTVVIMICIGIMLSLTFNASTYVTFSTAEKNFGKQFTVIGELNLDKEIIFEPKNNLLTFFASDSMENVRKVFFYNTKPQDFERSEKITMKGFATDSGFIANSILMKCPSKYNEDQLNYKSEI